MALIPKRLLLSSLRMLKRTESTLNTTVSSEKGAEFSSYGIHESVVKLKRTFSFYSEMMPPVYNSPSRKVKDIPDGVNPTSSSLELTRKICALPLI